MKTKLIGQISIPKMAMFPEWDTTMELSLKSISNKLAWNWELSNTIQG